MHPHASIRRKGRAERHSVSTTTDMDTRGNFGHRHTKKITTRPHTKEMRTIVEIQEMFAEVVDAMEDRFDGEGVEGRQLRGWIIKQFLVEYHTNARMLWVQPRRNLATHTCATQQQRCARGCPCELVCVLDGRC